MPTPYTWLCTSRPTYLFTFKEVTVTISLKVTLNFLGCTYLWLGQCMWFIQVHRRENYCKESAVTALSFLYRAKSSHTSLLERIQPFLRMTQSPQKSRFIASRSTIDAKLAVRLLSELHRQFNRPLIVVFVESAFDLVERNALWKALHARVIPDIVLCLLKI